MTFFLRHGKTLAAVALLAAAGAAGWFINGALWSAKHSDLKESHAIELASAVTHARDEERRRFETIIKEGVQGENDIADARADADSAADDVERLQQELSTIRTSYRADNSRLATKWATAAETVRVLTELLESCSGFSVEVAGAFEESRARGLTCERSYNALRNE